MTARCLVEPVKQALARQINALLLQMKAQGFGRVLTVASSGIFEHLTASPGA
ncbi:hypothetical protein [Ciceribacter ferrooxidans]|uniref:hypothetical protein n=1 Tax=Ciceribacter ferrooxidans TaxID=2509717 RepID=UPI0013EE019C|nr:hypothetical protein [Ciceribacter ferrooxidans]